MSIRTGSRCAAAIATGYVLCVAVSTVPALAHAATPGEEATAGTLAWVGCWRLQAIGEEEASQLLCLEPGEGPSSLRLSAIVDNRVVEERTLLAEGSRQPVSEDGCKGWKRATLSADQQRLYLQSETTCEGGNQSSLSGAWLIVSAGHWVDINVARVDGDREMVVRHYRIADADTERRPETIQTAARAARVAAAASLEGEDVIEALEYVDPVVVEAMLFETRPRFPLDSRLLLRLDDAGVPGQIIDLMLALSYPGYFAVQEETVNTPPSVDDYFRAPWFYGYGHGSSYDFNYDYDYEHHDPDPGPRPRGKVISGHGYTRVQPIDLSSGDSGSGTGGAAPSGPNAAVSSGSSGGSESSASGSGYQGSSTSTRKAVPR
jgi:hypothetical protein